MQNQAKRNCFLTSPTRQSRKKEVAKSSPSWAPPDQRKKHIDDPTPREASPCRRKIIVNPAPAAALSPSRVKKFDHAWASQHTAYVDTSPPRQPVRKRQVSPVEHKDRISRRKSYDLPSPERARTSRKKPIKPPEKKEGPAVRRKVTSFSRRHLKESEHVPVVVKKKPLVPPYALHSEAPAPRKKSVPRPVPKQNSFVSGKRAIKPAWNVTTIEIS